MKLQITPKEYRRLLQMLYLADHVLNGRREDEPTGLRLKCEEVLQGFLGYATQFSCADLVEEPEPGLFNFTAAMPEEPGVSETVNDYEEDIFWQELVTRLAGRDYERIHGRPSEPDPDGAPETDEQHEQREDELERLEDGYWREFEASGVKNLELIKGGFGRPS
ncbi:MAG: hypothetical protein IPL39_11435 [Opitutaceae bacterium]|nr:hypothetical protein [Opitutaceae bacterium]